VSVTLLTRLGTPFGVTSWCKVSMKFVFFVLPGVMMLTSGGEIHRHLAHCLHDVAKRHFTPQSTLVVSFIDDGGHCAYKGTTDLIGLLLEELHQSALWHLLVSVPHDTVQRTTEDRHDNYIIFGQTADTVRIHIMKLKTSSGWNPRANFVIVVTWDESELIGSTLAEDIFTELWKENIVNVIVTLPTPDSKQVHYSTLKRKEFVPILDVYAWFPYQPLGRCCENIKTPFS